LEARTDCASHAVRSGFGKDSISCVPCGPRRDRCDVGSHHDEHEWKLSADGTLEWVSVAKAGAY
jgi:hypothetical protein